MDRRRFLQTTAAAGLRPRRSRDPRPRRARAPGRGARAQHRLSAALHRDGQGLFRRRDGEDRHHRERQRPHQCGAVRPGLRLHRRPRAQRLCQGQGRGAARRGQLRRPRQHLFLRRQGAGADRHRLAGLLQGQDHRRRPVRRHAELDHPLSARQMEARPQEGRDADRDRQFRHHRRGAQQAGPDRRGDRAVRHPGRAQQHLGRAVLQRAEGARPLRLFHPQCAARYHPEGPRARAHLRARHGQGLEAPLCEPEGGERDRQGAVPDHAARRPALDARPLLRRRDVEPRRHDQQAGLGDRERRGARSRPPQERREVR